MTELCIELQVTSLLTRRATEGAAGGASATANDNTMFNPLRV
jgi:hypothetical protein